MKERVKCSKQLMHLYCFVFDLDLLICTAVGGEKFKILSSNYFALKNVVMNMKIQIYLEHVFPKEKSRCVWKMFSVLIDSVLIAVRAYYH